MASACLQPEYTLTTFHVMLRLIYTPLFLEQINKNKIFAAWGQL